MIFIALTSNPLLDTVQRTTASRDAANASHGTAGYGRPAEARAHRSAHPTAYQSVDGANGAEPTCGCARSWTILNTP